MGTLYRVYCSACDVSTAPAFGACLSDPKRGGKIIQGSQFVYVVQSGELVRLRHPGESRALKAAGGGPMFKAAMQGRLLNVKTLVCADCGSPNKTASLETAGAGCIMSLFTATVAIACNILLFNFHPLVELAIVLATVTVPVLIVDRCLRLRYRENVVPHECSHCAECNSGEVLPLHSCLQRSLPCPRCKQKTVSIETAGRS